MNDLHREGRRYFISSFFEREKEREIGEGGKYRKTLEGGYQRVASSCILWR